MSHIITTLLGLNNQCHANNERNTQNKCGEELVNQEKTKEMQVSLFDPAVISLYVKCETKHPFCSCKIKFLELIN